MLRSNANKYLKREAGFFSLFESGGCCLFLRRSVCARFFPVSKFLFLLFLLFLFLMNFRHRNVTFEYPLLEGPTRTFPPYVVVGVLFISDMYSGFLLLLFFFFFFFFLPRRDSPRRRIDEASKWIADACGYDFENYANSVVAIQGDDLGRPKIT